MTDLIHEGHHEMQETIEKFQDGLLTSYRETLKNLDHGQWQDKYYSPRISEHSVVFEDPRFPTHRYACLLQGLGSKLSLLPRIQSESAYDWQRATGSLQKFLNMEKHYAKIIKGPSRKCEREFRKYANKALGDETERTHALTSFKEACASVMEDQCRDFLATYRKLKDEASEYLIVDGMIAPELEEEIIRGLGSFPYRPTKRHIELLSTECRPTITSIANMIGWIRKNLPEDGNLDSILASVSPLMREVHALHTFATSYRNSNLNDIEADRGPERGTGDKTLPTEAEFDVDPSSDQQDSESELEYSSATDLEDY